MRFVLSRLTGAQKVKDHSTALRVRKRAAFGTSPVGNGLERAVPVNGTPAEHQHFARFNSMRYMLLGRGEREAQALKQSNRAHILALEHGEEAADSVVFDKLREHRLDRLARKAATPVGAGQHVGDGRATVRADCRLHISDELGRRKAYDPVEPLFLPIPRAPGLELPESGMQPLWRWRRRVLVFIDRWIAEDHEHFLGVCCGLWLERETASDQGPHARCNGLSQPAIRKGFADYDVAHWSPTRSPKPVECIGKPNGPAVISIRGTIFVAIRKRRRPRPNPSQ